MDKIPLTPQPTSDTDGSSPSASPVPVTLAPTTRSNSSTSGSNGSTGEQGREQERLAKRAEIRNREFLRSIDRMAEIMDQATTPTIERGIVDDPLLEACRIIGLAAKIPFATPTSIHADVSVDERLESICVASGVSMRTVALRGNWWQQDSGALLVFDGDMNPLAAIPRRRGYQLVDPVSGKRHQVKGSLAESLSQRAVMFYRPFPSQELGIVDLIKHSAANQNADLIRVLIYGLCAGAIGATVPYVTGVIFDTVIPASQRGQLLQLCLMLLAGAIAIACFDLAKSVALWRIETKAAHDVQTAVWDRLIRLPVPFFRKFAAGDLTMRAFRIDGIRQVISGTVVTSALDAVFSVFYLALLFVYSPVIACEAVAMIAVGFVIVIGLNLRALKFNRRAQLISIVNAGRVLEFLNGIAKIRISASEKSAFATWGWAFGQQRENEYRARSIANLATCFSRCFPMLATVAIFYQFGSSVHDGTIATGHFLAFLAAFTFFLGSMLSLGQGVASMLTIVPLYESAKPILRALPEASQQKSSPGQLTGEIEFNHVSFRYVEASPLILDGLSFRVPPGEFAAFVGPSGSGKSTVLRLLLGFESPESGTLYYDRQDMAGLDVSAVRRQMGVVLQNGKLMPGNVFSNIIGSAGSLTMDDAWEAARMAGLAEDIEAMPMGMHTMVAEGGSTLSGGQCQRLLIARAIIKRPRILLMDEATSALDNRSQEIVSESLEKLNATRIVIAHRLSTIVHADRIFYLDQGRIIEQGCYEELMDRNGPFAALAKRQIA